MKLYGEKLKEELSKRRLASQTRKDARQSVSNRAKELGIKPSEYLAWEHGSDICPHEKHENCVGGCHKPFLLMKKCKECGNLEIIAKIETEEDCDKYKDDLEDALKNAGMLKEDN